MNVYDLQGKRILITGAAVRIGRSMALAFARAGADLVIHYGTSLVPAETLRQEVMAAGRRADILQANLLDPVETQALIPRALESGPLDGLVNNASIFDPLRWDTTGVEDWNRNLTVNLTAPFLLCQSFARTLETPRTGRILNMIDWRAFRPGADHLPYTIAKAALAALTQSLAVALGPRITVNGLALGAILPPTDQNVGNPAQGLPIPRWAELSEVDESALFLMAGPRYITGEIIHLDGGRHLV